MLASMEEEIQTWSVDSPRPDQTLIAIPRTPLCDADACYLLALIEAGSHANLARTLKVSRAAVTQALVLFFAGPRLYPSLGPSDLLFGLGSVVSVSLLSAAYPAMLAARVPPILAMQARE